jgi:Uma2 family endonuclease
MSEPLSRARERELFEESAQEYLRYLREERPEHFMESTSQAQQRKIFVACFDLIMAANPQVHAYNELLVQWRRGNGRGTIRKVVPDNMVVLSQERPDPDGSYDLPFQPARPFWVLEYVSKNSQRKDYEDSFDVYERELEVPYYLIFYPETQDLSLYRYNGRYYVSVKPNEQGRYAVREIEVELALIDGWVRFWHRRQLLPLPAELQQELDDARRQIVQLDNTVSELQNHLAALQAELDRLRQQGG